MQTDNFACFVQPGRVVLTWTDDESDTQFTISNEALAILQAVRDAHGRELEITLVHQPGLIFITEDEAQGVDQVPGFQPTVTGARLAGSFINSYYANGIVILPVVADPHDEATIETYEQLFPERRIVTVPGR